MTIIKKTDQPHTKVVNKELTFLDVREAARDGAEGIRKLEQSSACAY